MKQAYHVLYRRRIGNPEEVLWTDFVSKEAIAVWYIKPMRDVYEILKEDVSEVFAQEHCPAYQAWLETQEKKVGKTILRKALPL